MVVVMVDRDTGEILKEVDTMSDELYARFLAKVDKTSSPNGCWLWTGHVTGGYGQFYDGFRKVCAHRWSYEYHNDCRIGDDMVINHRCNNPVCCNPDCLEEVTQTENMRYSVECGRHYHGESHKSAKLNEAKVAEIRRLYSSGSITIRSLGERYGVTHQAISDVVKRKSWRHVA